MALLVVVFAVPDGVSGQIALVVIGTLFSLALLPDEPARSTTRSRTR